MFLLYPSYRVTIKYIYRYLYNKKLIIKFQGEKMKIIFTLILIIIMCAHNVSAEVVQLTTDIYWDKYPAWSPDGTKIAFVSSRYGYDDIWVMDSDGSNQKQLTTIKTVDGYLAWSPDGTKIAFSSKRSGDWDIWVMDSKGEGAVSLAMPVQTTSTRSFPFLLIFVVLAVIIGVVFFMMRKRKPEVSTEKSVPSVQLQKHAEDKLNAFKLKLQEAKELGLEVSKEEKLLTEAETLFNYKIYDKALDIAKNNIQSLETAINKEEEKIAKRNEFLKLIDSAKSKLTVAEKLGVVVSSAEDLFNKAKEYFNKENYENAIKLAKQSIDSTDKTIQESKPEVDIEFPRGLPNYNTWKETELVVKNTGSMNAINVKIKLSGDLEMHEIDAIPQVATSEPKTASVLIKPTALGKIPVNVDLQYTDGLNRSYQKKKTIIAEVGERGIEEEPTGIEIKRGYTTLPNNDIKFGIKVVNNTNYMISEVEVILSYTKTLLELKSDQIQSLGNLPPKTPRTAEFILKPLGCIHREEINASVNYKDTTGTLNTLRMRPKEIHNICPYLHGKAMTEGEYSSLAKDSEVKLEGITFQGISIKEMAELFVNTCLNLLYKVNEHELTDGTRILLFSGESLGEKVYYLLTVVIKEEKGLTQVVLRAHSNKSYGLSGFISEITDSIRNLLNAIKSAKEVGIINIDNSIHIYDSVIQRTSFGDRSGGSLHIKDSIIQRSNIGDKQKKV